MVEIYPVAVPRYPCPVALNIKNEDTVAAARELAALTGESITQAIDTAVRERLGRERASVEDRWSAIHRLTRQMQEAWGPSDGTDPTAFLYDDETGLPA